MRLRSGQKVVAGRLYRYYLMVYDVDYTRRLACYEFRVEVCELLPEQVVEAGRVYEFNVKVKI